MLENKRKQREKEKKLWEKKANSETIKLKAPQPFEVIEHNPLDDFDVWLHVYFILTTCGWYKKPPLAAIYMEPKKKIILRRELVIYLCPNTQINESNRK